MAVSEYSDMLAVMSMINMGCDKAPFKKGEAPLRLRNLLVGAATQSLASSQIATTGFGGISVLEAETRFGDEEHVIC